MPTNTSFATALEITALPYTITQNLTGVVGVGSGGSFYDLWYKLPSSLVTAAEIIGALSVYPGVVGMAVDRPRTFMYLGPVGADPDAYTNPYRNVASATTSHARIQTPLDAVQDYYFLVRVDSITGPLTHDITFDVYRAPAFDLSTVPEGSILVNSDEEDFPAAILSPTTGSVIGFLMVAAGETGDRLNDGRFILADAFDNNLVLYNADRTQAATAAITGNLASGNQVDRYYVIDGSLNLKALNTAGTVLDTYGPLPAGSLLAAVSRDDTIAYITNGIAIGSGGANVMRWDLVNDVALSDLAAAVATYNLQTLLSGITPGGILVLKDDTILVEYFRTNEADSQIRRYSPAGALLNTYTFVSPFHNGLDRIAHDPTDDGTTFWVWLKGGGAKFGIGSFRQIRVSDGATLVELENAEAQFGYQHRADADTNDDTWAHPFSCPFLLTGEQVVVIIDHSAPCPCPCECAKDGTSPTGAIGDPLEPVDDTWEADCTGGGTAHTAAEIVDDEDWTDTTPPKSPDAWLQIQTAPYPEGETPILKWGMQALSDTERFVEGRVREFGDIDRGSSDKDGHYPPARARIVVVDDDATVRTRLGDPANKYIFHNEVKVPLLSYAGRKAGLDPLPLMQGHIVDVQPALNRQAMVEVQDIVGAHFGLLDPEQKIGLFIGDEHPNAPEGTHGKKIYNIVYGEHSDIGALNGEGEPADIGMIPCVDCGDDDLDNPGGPIIMVSPPQNLTAIYQGDDVGDNEYHYAIVGVTNFGHTARSNIVSVSGLPDSLDVNDYVELNWDAPATGAEHIIAYWVLGRTNPIPNKRLDTMNNDGTYVNPETTYSDGKQGSRTDFDREKAVQFVNIPTAPASTSVWTWFAVAMGTVDVLAIYGSDLGGELTEENTPTRVRLTIGSGDIQTPEVRVVGGITQTGFYARGPRVQHHRDGQITFAANVCGYKGINDLLINQVFLILQSFLNEFVEKNDGEGYRTGSFGPIETFTDGTPKFWTSKFQEAQDITAAWLNTSLGYLGSLAVTQPTALAEILRDFFVSFGGHLTSDHHGRVYPYLVDMDEPGTGAPLFKERREISRVVSHDIAWRELENRLTYDYHFNYDTQSYRSIGHLVEDLDSIAAHGGDRRGVFQTEVKPCKFGNDAVTMADRWTRHLELYADAPRYVTWATNLERVQLPNGSPVRFTHRKEGVGVVGESASVGVLMQTTTRVDPYELIHRVRITLRNLADVEGGENTVVEDQLVADFTGEPLVSEDGSLPLLTDGA